MDQTAPDICVDLPDETATAGLGVWFASRLAVGDSVLLEGPIGAGKSHFARALIQARLGRAEDVPSPSFTLVQTYEADVEIWHADLYRLGHPDEVMELGLDQAFSTAITLIEWSDRLGSGAPKDAIRLKLEYHDKGRKALIWCSGRVRLVAGLRNDWGPRV